MRTNGTTFSAARRNKYKMIETGCAAGLRTAQQLLTDDAEEAVAWAEANGYWPCAAQPLASASTDGVCVCRDATALRAALRSVLSTTVFNGSNTEVPVHSYLEGTEYLVDTASADGHAFVCGGWQYDKRLLPGGKPLCNRGILLSPTDPAALALIDYTRVMLDALRIHNGPAHTELIITQDSPALLDVGARVNGHLHPAFHDMAIGVNSADLTALACIHPGEFPARYRAASTTSVSPPSSATRRQPCPARCSRSTRRWSRRSEAGRRWWTSCSSTGRATLSCPPTTCSPARCGCS